MSQVNKTFYPDRPTSLSGIQLTSARLSEIVVGPWDESIAISQSNSEDYAPFCNLNYFSWYNNELLHQSSDSYTQKIAMMYTQDYNDMARFQMYNGTVEYNNSSFNIGQLAEAPYNMYSLTGDTMSKGVWTANLVATLQARYSLNNYFLITGANFQKILAVICVGFTDNTYCSLKYYDTNKTGTLASKTPQCLFMIGLIDNDGSGTQTFNGFNIGYFDYKYWQLNNNNLTTGTWSKCNITQMPILQPYTAIPGSRGLGTIINGTICMPLVACLGGGKINLTNYWSSKPAAGSIVVGGKLNEDYTMVIDGTSWVYPVISQAGMDKAFKVAATYGIPFSNDFPSSMHEMYSDPTITTFIPVANDGGYYNGSYEVLTQGGTVNPNLSPENSTIWGGGKDAPYNDREYDPNVPIPVTDIDLNTPTITPMNLFNKTYILSHSKVQEFSNFLFRTMVNDSSFWKTILTKSLELFGGGINAVTSLKMYPFDVRRAVSAQTEGVVILGACPIKDDNDEPLEGYILPDNANVLLDLGSFKIAKKYNNFLDYGPYTSISLYIPYVGSVSLDPNIYMDHTVSVKMIVDLTTGVCTAVVYSDENMVTYHKGVIGIDVPINSINANNTDRTMASGALGAAAVGIGLAGSLVGAPMAVVGAMAGLTAKTGQEIGSYDSVPMNNGGQASPGCGLYMPNYCYVTIARPKMAFTSSTEIETYNKEVGYTTSKPTTMYEYLRSLGTVAGATISGELANTFTYQSYTGNLSPEELNEVANIVRQGIKFGVLVFPNS